MKRIIALVLVIVMLSATFSVSFAGDVAELRSVKISGVYHQSQARKMLKKVNDFRLNKVTSTDPSNYLGEQAWAWNYRSKNGQIEYFKQAYSSLNAYTYDYELEQIAMQRAAEIAVYYGNDHTRPNNTSWRTAHTVYNPATNVSIGENIFATTNCDVMESINYAFDWWLESNDPYEGQSHRRNLLGVSVDTPFVSTAFACFEVNEVFYWVELFRSVNVNPTATSVSIERTTKNVVLSDDFIKSIVYTPVSESINLQIGQSKTILPEGNLISTNHILSYQEVSTGKIVQVPTVIDVEATLKSSNTSVVSVSGTTIKAVGAGTAIITATAYGKSIQYTVNVQKNDISSALVTFKDGIDTFIYDNGKPIKPIIQSVTIGSTVLSNSDYELTYADNTDVGTGVVAISGKGNYQGAVTKAFYIINKADCKHSIVYDPAVAGTCMVKGKTAGTHCGICGEVFKKQEDTGFGPHKEKTTRVAVEPTCTEGGNTEEVICETCGRFLKESESLPALGHDYPENYTNVKATLSKNGMVYKTCARCDAQDIKQTIYYPKTFTLSKPAFTYNGKVQKPKLAVKGSDGKKISTSNFSYSIPNGKKVGRYKITIKFKGNYSGTKYLYYDILPKNSSKFVLSAAKKAFKVKWNTQKDQTKGYQIQYSLYSNFKSAKTFTLKNNKYNAATISKLTGGKKYYVRIRTYGTVKIDGKSTYIYSTWSGAKTVKTKK